MIALRYRFQQTPSLYKVKHYSRHTLYWLCLLLIASLWSCQPNDPVTPTTPDSEHTAYLLNEGVWGGNDADLSLIDLDHGTLQNNYFSTQNGRGLGDLGQDLISYGTKLYCSVYTSNTIEVIDPTTGRAIRQINMGSRGPRYLAASGDKVYVSCYDKTVVRIDTATLTIDGTCPLSSMLPEGLAVYGDKLYVCNAWQTTDNGGYEYDSTLAVIDLTTFRQVDTLTIKHNPAQVKPLSDGRLVVNCIGNYADEQASLLLVDPTTGNYTDLQIPTTAFDLYHDLIYLYHYDYTSTQSTFLIYNVATSTLSDMPISGNFTSPYHITLNPLNGDIYIADSRNYRSNGDLFCFSNEGHLRWSAETTVGPTRVVIP